MAERDRGLQQRNGAATGNRRDQLPPFLRKTYYIVNNPDTNDTLRWSESGESFVILDERKLIDLLPMHFKHNKLQSFYRQLFNYGFRKVPDRPEYENKLFLKGKPELLHIIPRPKNNKSSSAINSNDVQTPAPGAAPTGLGTGNPVLPGAPPPASVGGIGRGTQYVNELTRKFQQQRLEPPDGQALRPSAAQSVDNSSQGSSASAVAAGAARPSRASTVTLRQRDANRPFVPAIPQTGASSRSAPGSTRTAPGPVPSPSTLCRNVNRSQSLLVSGAKMFPLAIPVPDSIGAASLIVPREETTLPAEQAVSTWNGEQAPGLGKFVKEATTPDAPVQPSAALSALSQDAPSLPPDSAQESSATGESQIDLGLADLFDRPQSPLTYGGQYMASLDSPRPQSPSPSHMERDYKLWAFEESSQDYGVSCEVKAGN